MYRYFKYLGDCAGWSLNSHMGIPSSCDILIHKNVSHSYFATLVFLSLDRFCQLNSIFISEFIKF